VVDLAREFSEKVQESLLGHVHGIGLTPREAVGQHDDPVPVAAVQCFESTAVTSVYGFDERFVADLAGVSRHSHCTTPDLEWTDRSFFLTSVAKQATF
jgi:hypothetical protein